ncbi:helicase [Spirochaetia bacterium]|nr:helicase [Spirochaetia bacterium]
MKNKISGIISNVTQTMPQSEINAGTKLFDDGRCIVLSQSPVRIEFAIDDEKNGAVDLFLNGDTIIPHQKGKETAWDRYSYACLLRYEHELRQLDPAVKMEYKKYTRDGMIRRVLNERREKAEKAEYKIQWADTIYGDHLLTNEYGAKYKIFLRDFDGETGYSDNVDAAFNKLGTTKHIMYAFNALKANKRLYNKLDKTYPFIEIYCDPLNDYKIRWYYPYDLPADEGALIAKFFKNKSFIEEADVQSFLEFIEVAEEYETICIRPEVREKVERRYEDLLLAELRENTTVDFSCIKGDLFPYQKEGVEFVLFRKAAIIADEMGLGKTIQAIAAAVLKKEIFGFRKALVVCPATLKSQWKKEIEKFSGEKALILSGVPEQREQQYREAGYYFSIVNYETVLRDSHAINRAGFDLLILDEAQKIKNYETKTATAVKRLRTKHKLVITGTPIENRLIDIFSIISSIDPYYLGPLWEFSYQHCLFDPVKPNKINGYYDLQHLNERLAGIVIRREKHAVFSQLPDVQHRDVMVELTGLQKEYHADYMMGIGRILQKKFLTPYDLQKLNLLLANARMVCDSTFLIDSNTNDSPKLNELADILFEKLDIKNGKHKVIIFSEWIKVHKLIADMLRKHRVGFTELNGKVPVKLRGDVIKGFEDDPDCKVFLSTEAGGAGLNLQAADIVINFELPWNPAKKNQRIGRIDRMGQKSNKLSVYNLISRSSIEQQIAAGLLVKQNLFEGVLGKGKAINYVDFSTKGRSQFIQQLEALVNGQQTADPDVPVVAESRESPVAAAGAIAPPQAQQTEALEQVLNSGMQFLAGLFKMSTGTEINLKDQKIEVDKETGEVCLRFKLN